MRILTVAIIVLVLFGGVLVLFNKKKPRTLCLYLTDDQYQELVSSVNLDKSSGRAASELVELSSKICASVAWEVSKENAEENKQNCARCFSAVISEIYSE